MNVARTLLSGLLVTALAATALAGCEDEPVVGGPQPGGAKPAQPPRSAAAAAAQPDAGVASDAGVEAEMPPLPLREFQEADFTETDRSRDPFRPYEQIFAAQAVKSRVTVQRQVLVDRFVLEELKLVGIITRAPSRALLTDPSGLGWVVKVGDFVGKPELTHTGGPTGVDVLMNWRVDRIRDSDVVFIREDPSHPEIPPATRVIALRPLEESASRGAGARSP